MRYSVIVRKSVDYETTVTVDATDERAAWNAARTAALETPASAWRELPDQRDPRDLEIVDCESCAS